MQFKTNAKMTVINNGNTLNILGIDVATVALYSINGSMVVYDTDNNIDISNLNGMYIIVAKTINGNQYTAKALIKK